MSCSKVSSTLTDFASRSATTGRSSMARARRHSDAPADAPSRRTSSSSLGVRSSSTVLMPTRRSRSAVAGPTPGIAVACIGPSTSASVPGTTTNTPSGLLISLAILAISFDEATPTDAVSPWVRSVMSARIRATTSSTRPGSNVGEAARSTKASSSESGSTSSVSSRRRSMTRRLAARYASKRPPRKAA